MSTPALLFQRFLYISRLAPDATADTVSQILRQSRERNRADGISGALLFDGERFCQLIEGTPETVRRLASRIERDPRHEQVRVLHDAARTGSRLLAKWQTGYCDPELLDAIDGTTPVDSDQALTTFIALLLDCDLSH